ncbi:MAG: hypothetical protein FWE31_06055 [Firmicutes bacterium]|nr:hypothetical protein [Bacillota bacterium]
MDFNKIKSAIMTFPKHLRECFLVKLEKKVEEYHELRIEDQRPQTYDELVREFRPEMDIEEFKKFLEDLIFVYCKENDIPEATKPTLSFQDLNVDKNPDDFKIQANMKSVSDGSYEIRVDINYLEKCMEEGNYIRVMESIFHEMTHLDQKMRGDDWFTGWNFSTRINTLPDILTTRPKDESSFEYVLWQCWRVLQNYSKKRYHASESEIEARIGGVEKIQMFMEKINESLKASSLDEKVFKINQFLQGLRNIEDRKSDEREIINREENFINQFEDITGVLEKNLHLIGEVRYTRGFYSNDLEGQLDFATLAILQLMEDVMTDDQKKRVVASVMRSDNIDAFVGVNDATKLLDEKDVVKLFYDKGGSTDDLMRLAETLRSEDSKREFLDVLSKIQPDKIELALDMADYLVGTRHLKTLPSSLIQYAHHDLLPDDISQKKFLTRSIRNSLELESKYGGYIRAMGEQLKEILVGSGLLNHESRESILRAAEEELNMVLDEEIKSCEDQLKKNEAGGIVAEQWREWLENAVSSKMSFPIRLKELYSPQPELEEDMSI